MAILFMCQSTGAMKGCMVKDLLQMKHMYNMRDEMFHPINTI